MWRCFKLRFVEKKDNSELMSSHSHVESLKLISMHQSSSHFLSVCTKQATSNKQQHETAKMTDSPFVKTLRTLLKNRSGLCSADLDPIKLYLADIGADENTENNMPPLQTQTKTDDNDTDTETKKTPRQARLS